MGILNRLRRLSGRSRTRSDRIVDGETVRVMIAPNEMVAGMVGGALESERIPFVIKKVGLDFPMSPTNQRAIFVPLNYEEKARSIAELVWKEE